MCLFLQWLICRLRSPKFLSLVPTSYYTLSLKPNLSYLPQNLLLSWITAVVSLNHLPKSHLPLSRLLQSSLNPIIREILPKYKSNQINALIKTHVCLPIPIAVKSKISTITCKASLVWPSLYAIPKQLTHSVPAILISAITQTLQVHSYSKIFTLTTPSS